MLNLQLLNPNRIQIVTFLPYNMQTIEHQLLTKTTTECNKNVFNEQTYLNACLIVAKGGIMKAKTTSPWKYFSKIIESDDFSGVQDIKAANRKIAFRKDGDSLEILNLDDNETISIYNMDGVCEYQGTNHTVTLSKNNVYIIRTTHETLKFSF